MSCLVFPEGRKYKTFVIRSDRILPFKQRHFQKKKCRNGRNVGLSDGHYVGRIFPIPQGRRPVWFPFQEFSLGDQTNQSSKDFQCIYVLVWLNFVWKVIKSTKNFLKEFVFILESNLKCLVFWDPFDRQHAVFSSVQNFNHVEVVVCQHFCKHTSGRIWK